MRLSRAILNQERGVCISPQTLAFLHPRGVHWMLSASTLRLSGTPNGLQDINILVFALGTSCWPLGTSTALTETLARSSCRWNPAYASYWSVHGVLCSDHKCVVLQDGDNISGVLRSLYSEQQLKASKKSHPFLPKCRTSTPRPRWTTK